MRLWKADEVEVRPVQTCDESLLLEWRNDHHTRAQSFDPRSVLPDDHRAWFRRLLDDPKNLALLAKMDGLPVGTVRLEQLQDGARISITVAPSARGRGLAVPLIEHGVRAWFQRSGGRVIAEIRPGNEASLRSFASAGFRLVKATEERVVMERSP